MASSHPRTACTCQFVSVIGQVASSHPRTACTYPFDIRRVTSSDPRTARAFYFVSVSQLTSSCPRTACASLFPVSQVTSSCPRTACAFYTFFQPSNQLKYKSSLRPLLSIFPVKWPVRVQEQLVPVKFAIESPQ